MNRIRIVALVGAAALATFALYGCATQEAAKPVTGRISALPPMQRPADNPTSPAKVALGKQLFVDKRLSGSGQMACQSCHCRHLGWTDAQLLSKRSVYNVGYQTAWYWDGRSPTLEAQILAASRNQIGADPAKVAAIINGLPGEHSLRRIHLMSLPPKLHTKGAVRPNLAVQPTRSRCARPAV
jgi:hypothetical protein